MNRRRAQAGFTLVELMVAMTIAIVLVALLGDLVGGVCSTWLRSRETMDNFSTARALVNALDRDLRSAVIRQDLAAFPGREKSLAFYARQFGQDEASDSMRALTFVKVSLEQRAGISTLVRTDEPFDFEKSGPTWIDAAAESGAPPSTKPVSRTMAGGVYAFCYRFVQRDGSESATYHDEVSDQPTRAVRVSLAILNERADALLRQASRDGELRSLLATTAAAAVGGAGGAWEKLISAGSIAVYPKPVAEGLRFYERVVPLTPSGLYVQNVTAP